MIRVAAASPRIKVGDVNHNVTEIIRIMKEAFKDDVAIIGFPELSITGYTCGDLFNQDLLIESSYKSLIKIRDEIPEGKIVIVGLPYRKGNSLYNCAAILNSHRTVAIIPKSFIPNYNEFYELRYFTPYDGQTEYEDLIPFGNKILIKDQFNGVTLGVEICEDLWVPNPPSESHALNGANIIFNLSASDELAGKAEYRRDLVRMHSSRLVSGYIYANTGSGESTSDMVFTGHSIIAENGNILDEMNYNERDYIYNDIDLDRINHDRIKMNSFKSINDKYTIIKDNLDIETLTSVRSINQHPFVCSYPRYEEIIKIQTLGLIGRLKTSGITKVVIGVSGGLDSTLALLIAVRTFDQLKYPRSDINCITMPYDGNTSVDTRRNAVILSENLNCSIEVIPIKSTVGFHMSDIGLSEDDRSITYENCQARYRTMILFNKANMIGAMVLGTGDMSELALGWCTYNGDHMSNYNVNCSIPKTMVKGLVDHISKESDKEVAEYLDKILATPVSPELLPNQVTEDTVGPYELHDFFLYYYMRYGFTPNKIFYLACRAFDGKGYDKSTILNWMKVFYKRFFGQQFKRNCVPDGPMVGSISLSPRGVLRMPSDASNKLWMDELEEIKV
jgi:NAD+ synthase (glutamine-hydrolysing)